MQSLSIFIFNQQRKVFTKISFTGIPSAIKFHTTGNVIKNVSLILASSPLSKLFEKNGKKEKAHKKAMWHTQQLFHTDTVWFIIVAGDAS